MSTPSEAVGPISLDQARTRLAELSPRLDEFVVLRADLADLRADLEADGYSPRGGVAELKALEAKLHAELEYFATSGAQLKGFAPVLLDWLGERDGVPVLWCWLEGEGGIDWYHRADAGFMGRRRV